MAKKIRFKIITFEKLVKIMVWIGIIFLVVGITASFPLAHWMKKENNPTIEYVLTDKSRPEPNTDDMVKYLHQKGNNLWKHADKDFRDESKTAAVKFLKENQIISMTMKQWKQLFFIAISYIIILIKILLKTMSVGLQTLP